MEMDAWIELTPVYQEMHSQFLYDVFLMCIC